MTVRPVTPDLRGSPNWIPRLPIQLGFPRGFLSALEDGSTIDQCSTSSGIRREMRRPAAVEPVIGHVKAEHRTDRNDLKGRDGDRANAVLAAAGYNFSLLLRWFEALLRALITTLLRTPTPLGSNEKHSAWILLRRLWLACDMRRRSEVVRPDSAPPPAAAMGAICRHQVSRTSALNDKGVTVPIV